MKHLIAWIKSNTITVVSCFVMLASFVLLGYTQLSASSFKEQMTDREKQLRTIKSLKSTAVTLPPDEPDGYSPSQSITVNPAAIDDLKKIYARLDQEYTDIFDAAIRHNEFRHLPMVDQMFPDSESPALPFEAREAYRRAFAEMLRPFAANTLYPRLNAGPAPDTAQLGALHRNLEREYLREVFPLRDDVQASSLTPSQFEAMKEAMREKFLGALMNFAEGIHVYAETDPNGEAYPFDLGAWSTQNTRPTWEQMWEGQLDLWMQQDVVQAIMNTNNVPDPKASVVRAPVKKLIKIEIVPGYIGINGESGVSAIKQTRGGGGIRGTRGNRGRTAAPFDEIAARVASPDSKLPDNFNASPTGRQSNGLYDVRHLWLTLHVDSQRAPNFLENLSKVNFMTVLYAKVSDVDEYEALREGYVYGSDDVIEMRLLIESIWLRDWTTRLMPDAVRKGLGVPDDPS